MMPKPKTQPSNNTNARTDYAIILLNAEDVSLNSILDVYYAESALQKRRCIVGINMETITLAIMSEKENPDLLRARAMMMAGESVPLVAIMLIINRYIDEYLKENDRILTLQAINARFDFLDHWMANDDNPVINTKSAAGKGKAKEKPIKDAPKGKDGKYAPLQKFEPPDYEVKDWSALALRGQNSNKRVYIEDSPEDGPILYVVIMGIYNAGVLTELMRASCPVLAVIKLVASDRETFMDPSEGSFSAYWRDIERIKMSNTSKSIAFYDVMTNVHPNPVLQAHSEQVNEELCCLVYDSQDRRRQHKHYQDNIKVYDVQQSGPCQNMDEYSTYNDRFENMDVQQITVEYIHEALLEQVCEQSGEKQPSESTRRTQNSLASIVSSETVEGFYQKSCSIVDPNVPLQCEFAGKYLLERQDALAQAMLKGLAPEMYRLRMQFQLDKLVMASCLDRFIPPTKSDAAKMHRSKEYLDNTTYLLCDNDESTEQLLVPNNSSDEEQRVSKDTRESSAKTGSDEKSVRIQSLKDDRIDDIDHYVELLSASALRQQLAECMLTYRNVQHSLISNTDSTLVTFSNATETLTTSDKMHCLTTRVCFRDYVDYIIDEQHEWIQSEEMVYEQAMSQAASIDGRAGGDSKRLQQTVLKSSFLVNGSLKKDGDQETPIISGGGIDTTTSRPGTAIPGAVIPEPSPSKRKKSLNAAKSKASTNQVEGISFGKDTSSFFAGFNLDDRRQQLNSLNVIYQSSLMHIKCTFDEWLYQTKNLSIVVEMEEMRVIFGKTFDNTRQPLRNIDNVLFKLSNGTDIVLEVVPQNPVRPVERSRWDAELPEVCEEPVVSASTAASELVLRIARPNGLLLKTEPNLSEYVVVQTWTKANRAGEKRRVLYPNGWIVVHGESGNVRVMSANGMIVQTGDESNWANEMEYVDQEEVIEEVIEKDIEVEELEVNGESEETIPLRSKPVPDVLHKDVFDVLWSVLPDLCFMCFKLTTTDGLVYIVKDKTIIKTLQPLYLQKSFDYWLGEKYLRREDGFKILHRTDGTRCLYPDGTQISSIFTMESMPSFQEFEFDDDDVIAEQVDSTEETSKEGTQTDLNASEEQDDVISIYRKSVSLTSSAKSALERQQMIRSVVTKFQRFATVEVFAFVDGSYTMEHDDYETVVFENAAGNKRLRFPGAGLDFTRSECVAKVGNRIEISCDLADLKVAVRQCKEHGKFSTMRIHFDMKAPLILDCDDGFNRRFTVDRLGVHDLHDDLAIPANWQQAKLCDCKRRFERRTRHFVVKSDWMGYEILSAKVVEQMIEEPAADTVFVHRDGDDVTLLERVAEWKIKRTEDADDKLTKDVHNVKCCERTLTLRQIAENKLPSTILFRHFVKVKKSYAEVVDMPVLSRKSRETADGNSKSGTEASLKSVTRNCPPDFSNKGLLCEAANRAIEAFLAIDEQVQQELLLPPRKPMSDLRKQQIEMYRYELHRANLYRRMLRTGYIPPYDIFHAASNHVRNLDEDDMNERIDLWEARELEVIKQKTANAVHGQGKPLSVAAAAATISRARQCQCLHFPCCC